MSKHTPGPWQTTKAGYRCGDLVLPVSDARSICQVSTAHAEHEANARLIAAAPELLAALKRAINACETSKPPKWELDSYRAIVAKAEGRE